LLSSVIACTVLIQSQSVMDRQTNTDRGVAREKSCAVLNFARFDSLVCVVARSREKSRSLSLVPFLARYRSLSLLLTGLELTQSNLQPAVLCIVQTNLYKTGGRSPMPSNVTDIDLIIISGFSSQFTPLSNFVLMCR